ncbi:MAG: FUN14 domain-containing protein [Pseudomonadota bacterium]
MNESLSAPVASLDILSSAFFLPNVGAPLLIGMAVGYFAKKILRVALLLGGAAVILLFFSEYYGITGVNDQSLQEAAQAAAALAQQSGGFLVNRLSRFTCQGISAVAGFFAGLRMG